MNSIRGQLAEFGLVFPRSTSELRNGLAAAAHDDTLPIAVRELVTWAREDLERLDQRIAACDRAIGLACRADPDARRVQQVCGVGPTTGKARLGSITKSGDAYLRTLLVQGARSTLKCALRADPQRATRIQRWAAELLLQGLKHVPPQLLDCLTR
jgi:transposase